MSQVVHNGSGIPRLDHPQVNLPTGEWRYPLSYVRSTSTSESYLAADPVFVYRAGVNSNWAIRGQSDDYTFWNEDPITASGGEITNSLNAGTPLPETIFSDGLQVTWEVTVDGGTTWIEVGQSTNHLYVTGAAATGDRSFETVLHLGSEGAAGLNPDTQQSNVVSGVWGEFSGLDVHRVNPTLPPLTYYGFRDEDGNGVWDAGTDTNFNSPTLCTVTSASGLLLTGNGQCNSWAELLRDTLGAQGVVAHRVSVVSKDNAFAVSNWATAGTGPWEIINDDAGVDGSGAVTPGSGEAADASGAPGQGNSPNPPSRFGNHYIVYVNGSYYDPSYGLGPYTDLKAYEDAAFAGTIRIIGSTRWLYEKPADDHDPNTTADLIANYTVI